MVKTAIEIAMEKVAKMPKLNSDEIHEQKKTELKEAGKSLAKRMLNGSLRKKNLGTELQKYGDTAQSIVKNALVEFLKSSLSLEESSTNQLILEIIKSIYSNLNLDEVNEALSRVIDEYQQMKQMEFALVIKQERKLLEEIGIAGSALVPNIKTNPFWEQKETELASDFSEKLESVGNMIKV